MNYSDKQPVFTIDETARILRVSKDTIRRLVCRNKLTRVPHLGGVRITRDSLENLLAGKVQK